MGLSYYLQIKKERVFIMNDSFNLQDKDLMKTFLKHAVKNHEVNIFKVVNSEDFEKISKSYKRGSEEYKKALKEASFNMFIFNQQKGYFSVGDAFYYDTNKGSYELTQPTFTPEKFNYISLDTLSICKSVGEELGYDADDAKQLSGIAINDVIASNNSLMEHIYPDNYLQTVIKSVELSEIPYELACNNEAGDYIIYSASKESNERIKEIQSKVRELEQVELKKLNETLTKYEEIKAQIELNQMEQNKRNNIKRQFTTQEQEMLENFGIPYISMAYLEALSKDQLETRGDSFAKYGNLSTDARTATVGEWNDEKEITGEKDTLNEIMEKEMRPLSIDDVNAAISELGDEYGERELGDDFR